MLRREAIVFTCGCLNDRLRLQMRLQALVRTPLIIPVGSLDWVPSPKIPRPGNSAASPRPVPPIGAAISTECVMCTVSANVDFSHRHCFLYFVESIFRDEFDDGCERFVFRLDDKGEKTVTFS